MQEKNLFKSFTIQEVLDDLDIIKSLKCRDSSYR
jgi:hypothetical protein